MQKDTLVKYLLDELDSIEEGHQDVLCPTAPEPQYSLLSEHSESQLATKGEVRAAREASQQQFAQFEKGFDSRLEAVVSKAIGAAVPAALSSVLSVNASTTGGMTYPVAGEYFL